VKKLNIMTSLVQLVITLLPIFKKIGLSKYSIHLGMVLYWILALTGILFVLSILSLTQMNYEGVLFLIVVLAVGFCTEFILKLALMLLPKFEKSRIKFRISIREIFNIVIVIAIGQELSRINFTPETIFTCINTGNQFQFPNDLFENQISFYLLALGILGFFFHDMSLSFKTWLIKGKKELKYGKQLSLKL
jgi:hypothetical protein